jgi:hypothetical protein
MSNMHRAASEAKNHTESTGVALARPPPGIKQQKYAGQIK